MIHYLRSLDALIALTLFFLEEAKTNEERARLLRNAFMVAGEEAMLRGTTGQMRRVKD